MEIQIQTENPPVPEWKELNAIAENQDGNSGACGALRTPPPPARRRELRPQVTSPPAPFLHSVESWNLTFFRELGRAAPSVTRGEKFCPSDCGGVGHGSKACPSL